MQDKIANQSAGSSPLARGTLEAASGLSVDAGLIPARAGNTGGTPQKKAQSRAHPRSRGEHKSESEDGYRYEGSSPLARGTRQRAHLPRPCRGLIPARAGNTMDFF